MALVDCPAGRVAGLSGAGVKAWLGIPYAEPPIGALRWRAPERLARSPEAIDATSFGPACPQNEPQLSKLYRMPPGIRQSEDCLTLNIWAPEGASRLGVMVWLHGGSLSIGSSCEPMYDGAALARLGIVIVTVNYRLGVLGWLAHPGLGAEADGISGNFGLLDQIAALEWVQENIAAFGGDPRNVTLAGESAGALSAMYAMASPRSTSLFHKVIAQSPYMISMPALSEAVHGLLAAEDIGEAFARSLGANDIAALRSAKVEPLLDATISQRFVPSGTVDADVLSDQLVSVLEGGGQARVPVLAGFNQGEIRSLSALAPQPAASLDDYELSIASRYGDLTNEFLRHYPAAAGYESNLAATRDAMYGWSTVKLAESQAAIGQPSYVYLWDHSYPEAEAQDLHAFHASEVPFVFGNIAATGPSWPAIAETARQTSISRTMMKAWASFVSDGVPRLDCEDWPKWSAKRGFVRFADGVNVEHGLMSNTYNLHDEVVRRRRNERQTPWNWNVGLIAPKIR